MLTDNSPTRWLILTLCLLVLAACGAPQVTPTPVDEAAAPPTDTPVPTDTPEPTPTATPAPTATPLPPTAEPVLIDPGFYADNVNPLTGLTVDDPSVLDRRPLLIKISNAPAVVRPQSGLSSADIIVEEMVEGGWTRFAAVFYSTGNDHVGSVRSVRLVDFQLAQAFDALLIFSGGSQGVIELLRREPIYPFNTISPQFGYGEPYFVRFPRDGLAYEHTLFSDTANFWQWAEEREVRREPRIRTEPGFGFSSSPPAGGLPATHARLVYARTTIEWEYDPITNRYMRWTDGVPHNDALTGQQLALDNVIVLSAYHEEIDILPEMFFGTEKSLYIELLGDGPATLMRDGLAFEGRWERATETSPITLIDASGAPLYLKPGHSFIHIIRAGFEEMLITP